MILLRRVIGDALRARRQAQHRTLREVSTAANVSLGYLSEIERGQKEASSELLAAVCEALGARLSELLHEVSSTVATSEQGGEQRPGLVPAGAVGDEPRSAATGAEDAEAADGAAMAGATIASGATGGAPPAVANAVRGAAREAAMAGGPRPAGHTTRAAAKAGRAKLTARATLSASTQVEDRVAVTIRHDTPLSTTLRARSIRQDVLSGV